MDKESGTAAEALSSIIRILNSFDEDARTRIIRAVLSFFHVRSDVESSRSHADALPTTDRTYRPNFSADNAPTPKDFLIEKQPKTDVERIACLAYYLTHFREMPHFKTLDLAKLNTEAAHPKFSNTAYSAANAVNMGYLAPAIRGSRQLSAAGEQFVKALPDREAARDAMTKARPRKLQRKRK
jgi:hypothetical protein